MGLQTGSLLVVYYSILIFGLGFRFEGLGFRGLGFKLLVLFVKLRHC